MRALIFDFDGLIIDSESTRYAAWKDVFDHHGHDLPVNTWAQYVGTADKDFDPYALLAQTIGGPIDKPAIRARRHAHESELVATTQALPGVAQLLQCATAAQIPIAIVSSSDRAWIHGHLTRLGLAAHFSCIISAQDVDKHKPDPTPYLTALNFLKVDACDVIAFEDSPRGVQAAVAAGIFCIAVPNPITKNLDLTHAHHTVDSLGEMSLEILRRLLASNSR